MNTNELPKARYLICSRVCIKEEDGIYYTVAEDAPIDPSQDVAYDVYVKKFDAVNRDNEWGPWEFETLLDETFDTREKRDKRAYQLLTWYHPSVIDYAY